MGKRSNFERKPRDFYPTPPEAVKPLLQHLRPQTTFIEPCAGNGALVWELEKHGHTCIAAIDIKPQHWSISQGDATKCVVQEPKTAAHGPCFITNPPWDRRLLHPIIENLSSQLPTWLLFDADWAHTRQAASLILKCSKIVSVGRVKWIPGSKMTGKDNCCWYLFGTKPEQTTFFGRPERK